MIKDVLPPTQEEECRNTAEILRDLAAQLRFANTYNLLLNLADNLDAQAVRFERQDAVQPLDVPRRQEVAADVAHPRTDDHDQVGFPEGRVASGQER